MWNMNHLTIEMESKIEIVKMKKDILGQLPDWVLGHLGEDRVSKFVKSSGTASD